LSNADKIVTSCNAKTVREAIGKILLLPKEDLNILIQEFNRRVDIRFGDNLIHACEYVQSMQKEALSLFIE